MELPSNVLYLVNQISGYSKNTVRLQTLNTQEIGPLSGASQLRLSLPVNSIVNMESLSMVATFQSKGVAESAANANDKVYALCPKGGLHALIDRLTFSAGGIALDNGTTPYNLIHEVKTNTETTINKQMSDNRVLNNADISAFDTATPSAWETANNGQEKTLILNRFHGFSACSPCYLDLNLLPEIYLTIQTTDSSIIPVQFQGSVLGAAANNVNPNFNGTECSWKLTNIYFTIEVVSFASGMLDAMNERLMNEKGSLDIVYPQYQMFSTDLSGSGGTIRGSVSTMSLDRVYAFARNSATVANGAPYSPYFTQQHPVKCEDNTSFAFQNAATNFISDGLTDWSFKINNAPYPLYKPTPLEAYNYVVNGNHRSYMDCKGSLIGSQKTWLNNCWTAMVNLCHSDDITLISGLDLRSINSQIAFEGTGSAGAARQLFMLTQQSSIARVGGGRALAVVA